MPSDGAGFDYTGSYTAWAPDSPVDPNFAGRVTNVTTVWPTTSSGVTYSLVAGNADPATVQVAAGADNVSRARRGTRGAGVQVTKRQKQFGQFNRQASSGRLPLKLGNGPVSYEITPKEWRQMNRRQKREVYQEVISQKRRDKSSGWGPLGQVSHALNTDLGQVASDLLGPVVEPVANSGVGETVGNVVRPAVRGVLTAANTGYEFAQGAFRDTVSSITEKGYLGYAAQSHADPIGSVASAAEQTVGGQAIRQIANGEPVELGSGYLPAQAYEQTRKVAGKEVPVTKETPGATLVPGSTDQYQIPNPEGGTVLAAQKEQEKRGLIRGHVITPGRFFAESLTHVPYVNEIIEPDSQAYDIASGLVDAAVAFYADPADKLLKGSSALRQEARTFKTFAPVVGGEIAENADVIDKLKTRGGKKLLDDLAHMDDWQDVKVRLTGTTTVSDDTAKAIARIENTDNIEQILTSTRPVGGVPTALPTGENVALLEAAGGVKTYRKFLNRQTFREWLASNPGRNVLSDLAEKTNAADIHDYLGKNFPVKTHDGRVLGVELADATTPNEVADVLQSAVGKEVTASDQFGPGKFGLGYAYRRATKDARIFGMVPASSGSFKDTAETYRTFQRRMQNAKIPKDEQNRILDQFLRNPDSKENWYNTLDTMMDSEKAQMISYGIDDNVAAEMTVAWRDHLIHERNYAVSQTEDGPVYAPGLLDPDTGELINFNETPMAHGEMTGERFELPNYRDVKQHTAYWNAMFRTPGAAKSETLLDTYMSIWRKGKLARPAWGVRVIGEEQLRMAASGLASVGRHPISAVAWALGNPDERLLLALEKHGLEVPAKLVRGAKQRFGRGMLEFEGGTFHDDAFYLKSQNQRWSAILGDDTAKYYGKSFLRVDRNNDQFARGLIEHMARLNDSVFRKAHDSSIAATKDWWWNDEAGKALREELSQSPKLGALKDDRDFADSYIDFVYSRTSDELTGDDPVLADAFRHLKLDDTRLADEYGRATDQGVKKMRKYLDEHPSAGPQYTKVQKRHFENLSQVQRRSKAADRFLQGLFTHLMAKPSDYLSRSPAFRQYYWQRGEELMAHGDDAARAQMLDTARRANLDKQTIARMERIGKVPLAGGETLSIRQMDTLAKAHALDRTKNLLYDLSEKSQFFDTARYVMPFGEAWKEVLTRWAGITYRNPQVIRRGQQAVQGARGAGWFYTDPQTGQEVFAFGANDLLANAGLPSSPQPIVGSVGGLNLVSNGLPGVGPVVQIPMSYIIPDTPDWQEFHDLVFPYGEIDKTGNVLSDVALQANPLPSFATNLALAFADPELNRTYGNRVSHMMNYLASTGDYDLSNPKDLERLYNDSKDQAKDQSLWSVLFQTFAPTAPITDWQVEDKKGRHVNAFAVAGDFYDRILKETEKTGGNWDDALDQFYDEYGDDNILLLQPMSVKQGGYLPPEDKAFDWVRKNPELKNLEPDVYGLFAPDGGAFSLAAYDRLLTTGELEPLTPRERLREAQNRIAGHIYRNQKDKIDPANDTQRAWLRDWQTYLEDQFPGWKPNNFNVGETDTLVRAVERAVDEPAFKKASPGLVRTAKAYLSKRAQALEAADGVDLSGKRDTDRRAWLRDWGAYYVSRNSDFAEMWKSVFSRELGDN